MRSQYCLANASSARTHPPANTHPHKQHSNPRPQRSGGGAGHSAAAAARGREGVPLGAVCGDRTGLALARRPPDQHNVGARAPSREVRRRGGSRHALASTTVEAHAATGFSLTSACAEARSEPPLFSTAFGH